MNNLAYYLLKGLIYSLSLLPFWLLYRVSDAIFLLIYYLIRYRRKVVRKNLTTSFPDMSLKEVKTIERRFYRWLCDYVMETIKLLSISDEKLLRHIEFRGVDQLEQVFDEGRNCAAILGHYCNWEWLSATGLAFKTARQETQVDRKQPAMGLIYHPLNSKAFDRLFIDIRSAHGGDCVPKKDILRHLLTYKHEDRRSLFGYISDQAPKWTNIHLWIDFLNHETPVFTGAERIMRKMNDAVFYVDMERPCRGKYICSFQLIYSEAEKVAEYEITYRFFQKLEASVKRQPAFYLWTHDRWKRTHAEFDLRYEITKGRTHKKRKE